MEHEAIVETAEASHSTEERHAIAEQPTEMFDVEAEMGTEDAPPAEAPSPSDEEIAEAEAAEPRLAPVEPATEIYAARTEAAGRGRVRGGGRGRRLLERAAALRRARPGARGAAGRRARGRGARADGGPPAATARRGAGLRGAAGRGHRRPDYDPDTGHEDVLEDTPDFLEDAPEDDELWFEQKPPKDFDFDD